MLMDRRVVKMIRQDKGRKGRLLTSIAKPSSAKETAANCFCKPMRSSSAQQAFRHGGRGIRTKNTPRQLVSHSATFVGPRNPAQGMRTVEPDLPANSRSIKLTRMPRVPTHGRGLLNTPSSWKRSGRLPDLRGTVERTPPCCSQVQVVCPLRSGVDSGQSSLGGRRIQFSACARTPRLQHKRMLKASLKASLRSFWPIWSPDPADCLLIDKYPRINLDTGAS